MCGARLNLSRSAKPSVSSHCLHQANIVCEQQRQRLESNDCSVQAAAEAESPNMDKFVVRGGNPLVGTVRVSGAKNAALPAMAAALLTEEPVILEAIPDVRDIQTERKLLEALGCEVELGYGRAHHRTTINARNLSRNPEASYEL